MERQNTAKIEAVIVVRGPDGKMLAVEALKVGQQVYEAYSTSLIGMEKKVALYNGKFEANMPATKEPKESTKLE